MSRIERMRAGMHSVADSLGNMLVEAFHYLALFAIGVVTAWGGTMAFIGMLDKGHISIDDILLLFIYLELAAMVGIYFKTNHMPIRFMIYVAITVIRTIIEPKIVGGQLGLHPIVTLSSMFVGARVGGVACVFGFPILLSLLRYLNGNGTIRLFSAQTHRLKRCGYLLFMGCAG